jgi:hypothetical protein
VGQVFRRQGNSQRAAIPIQHGRQLTGTPQPARYPFPGLIAPMDHKLHNLHTLSRSR